MAYVRRKIPVKAKQRIWIVNKLIEQNGPVCYLCLNTFNSKKDITLDHIIPKSKGGAYDIHNLRLAHEKCNHAKKNLSLEEYVALQEGF